MTVDDPIDEHGRLPGAGRGLDTQVLVERGGDPLARRLVDQLGAVTRRS